MSRPLSEATPVWPGDIPWSFTMTSSIGTGAPANVGAIHGTTHAGTHADAPFHVDPSRPTIDRLPLDAFMGLAWLAEISASGGPTIGAGELEALIPQDAERLLLRTGCDWRGGFPTSFRALSAEAARWCVARGFRLVGTDAPSVDPFGAESLEAHHVLVSGGVAILESLDLAEHPPGRYELVALPLRLSGADASPVRAAIRSASRAGES